MPADSANTPYCAAISAALPSGPANTGRRASIAASKISPRSLTSAVSRQRASATCSSTATSSRSGQTRRSVALRTQGSFSKASRVASRSTVKKLPRSSSRTMLSTWSRVVCATRPVTLTSRSGKIGSRRTTISAAYSRPSAASP